MENNSESVNENRFSTYPEDYIDIKKYLWIFYHHWKFCAIFLIIAMFIAYTYNKYTTPLYKVEAKLILGSNDEGMYISNPDKIMKELNFQNKSIISNELEILKSYTLNRSVMEKLDFQVSYYSVESMGLIKKEIYKNAPFKVILDSNNSNYLGGSLYIKILSLEEYALQTEFGDKKSEIINLNFGLDNSSGINSFKIEKTENFNEECLNKLYVCRINNLRSQTNDYRNKLDISMNDESGSILKIASVGPISNKESDYLNLLTQEYIRYGLELQNKTATNTIFFIKEQLRIVNDSLTKSEGLLQDYRLANKIVDLSIKGNTLFEQLTSMQTEHSKIVLRKTYLNYLHNFVITNKEIDKILVPSAMGVDDPVLNYLITDLKQCVEEQKKYAYGVNKNHPLMDKQNNKVEDLQTALLENIQTNIAHTNLTLNNIEQQINTFDRKIQKLPIDERQLINIERKFAVNNNIYNYLLEKRAEAGIAKAANISHNRVLDPADPENGVKIGPKYGINYIIALMLGLLIPFGLILIKKGFVGKITDYQTIKEVLKVPIIGKIKHCNLKSDIPVVDFPLTTVSEAFRTLRTNIQFLNHNNKGLTIAITSAGSGEGKTFCSSNLAIAIAMTGKKVLLANMDMRKAEKYAFLSSNSKNGLSTFLRGEDDVESIITSHINENFYFVSAGTIPPNPIELLFSSRLNEFFSYAKHNFDYIILDTPPIGLVSDVLIFSSNYDYIFYVLRMGKSKEGTFDILNEIINQPPNNKIHAVVNDMKSIHQYGTNYRDYSYYKEYSFQKEKNSKFVKKIKKGFSNINIFENTN